MGLLAGAEKIAILCASCKSVFPPWRITSVHMGESRPPVRPPFHMKYRPLRQSQPDESCALRICSPHDYSFAEPFSTFTFAQSRAQHTRSTYTTPVCVEMPSPSSLQGDAGGGMFPQNSLSQPFPRLTRRLCSWGRRSYHESVLAYSALARDAHWIFAWRIEDVK